MTALEEKNQNQQHFLWRWGYKENTAKKQRFFLKIHEWKIVHSDVDENFFCLVIEEKIYFKFREI